MKRSGSLIKRNGIYHCRYVIEGCVFQVSMRTKIKMLAEMNMETFMRDRQKGLDQYEAFLKSELDRIRKHRGEVVFGNPTVDDAWEMFKKSPNRPNGEPGVLKGYSMAWRAFKGSIPDSKLYLKDVSAQDAQMFMEMMYQRGVSQNTADKHLIYLKAIFRVILPESETSPFENAVSRGSKEVFSYKPVSLGQCVDLFKACPKIHPELQGLFMVMAYTGLRLKDAVTLRKQDIDLEAGIITVIPYKTRRFSNKARIGIHPAIREVLSIPTEEFIFPVLNRYNRDGLSKKIQAVFKEAKVVDIKDRPSGKKQNAYGASSFRHTMEDRLRQSGASQVVINTILCHSDRSMAGVYSTVTDKELIEAITAAYPDLRMEGVK